MMIKLPHLPVPNGIVGLAVWDSDEKVKTRDFYIQNWNTCWGTVNATHPQNRNPYWGTVNATHPQNWHTYHPNNSC